MREVASYTFDSEADDEATAGATFEAVSSAIEKWITEKGEEVPGKHGRSKLRFAAGGREAKLARDSVASVSGTVARWVLEEPIPRGSLRTTVGCAFRGKRVDFHCVLEVDLPLAAAPRRQEIFCPGFVRSVLDLPAAWCTGGTVVPRGSTRLVGKAGGREIARSIFDEKRVLPLVVISEQDGFPLHPELVKHATYDLRGLAMVIAVDDEASWELTRAKGKEWSCFNGAIRIYWPLTSGRAPRPDDHFLWTATTLLGVGGSVHDAEKGIRRRLRALLFEASSFVGSTPTVFAELRGEADAARIAAALKAAGEGSEWEKLANSYSEENLKLRAETAALTERAETLDRDVRRLKWDLDNAGSGGGVDTGVEEGVPPQTVSEALFEAREACLGDLVFGADVEQAAEKLASSAGPPEKLLAWLKKLAECAKRRRVNELAEGGVVKWLNANGARCSGEGEVVRKSRSEMARRTWDDGFGHDRPFELHLKVKEATSPDECVRVYFDWDDEHKVMVVGSIGRHP